MTEWEAALEAYHSDVAKGEWLMVSAYILGGMYLAEHFVIEGCIESRTAGTLTPEELERVLEDSARDWPFGEPQ